MSLTLNDANRRQSFSVAIINDSFYELDVEDFTLVLRIDPVEIPPPSNVILCPKVSSVQILDDDGKINQDSL